MMISEKLEHDKGDSIFPYREIVTDELIKVLQNTSAKVINPTVSETEYIQSITDLTKAWMEYIDKYWDYKMEKYIEKTNSDNLKGEDDLK